MENDVKRPLPAIHNAQLRCISNHLHISSICTVMPSFVTMPQLFRGVATTLGSGVYALIAVAAHDHAGPSVVLSILMAAVTSCLGGLCYSEVVTRFPKGGSAYSYMYATVGEVFAFFVGWCMLVEYAFGTALAAKACSQYLDVALDGKMSHLLQQHLGHIRVKGLDTFLDLPSIPVMLIACIIFIVSFKALCTLNNIFVIINLLVICGTVVIGIFNMDSENWIAGMGFFPGGISGVSIHCEQFEKMNEFDINRPIILID
ncbi:probable cationic amino acid transporter [Trichonephila clavipes]|nr:probable cationic amino acid transporter [Trichonephila clavipes]